MTLNRIFSISDDNKFFKRTILQRDVGSSRYNLIGVKSITIEQKIVGFISSIQQLDELVIS